MATCGSTDTNKCSVADSARRFLDTDNDPSEITFSVSMSDLVDIQVLEPYAVGSKRTLLEIEIPPAISSVEIVSVVVYMQWAQDVANKNTVFDIVKGGVDP